MIEEYSKACRFIVGNDPPCRSVRFVGRHREWKRAVEGRESQTTFSLSLSRADEQENRLIVSPNNGSSVKAASVAS